VFKSRVLRRTFGPKRYAVTGDWRKMNNEQLHNLYSSPYIIRMIKLRMSWVGHVTHMAKMRSAYKILVGKPEGKRPLGTPRHKWEDNIKMNLREIGLEDVDRIHLAQDRNQWQAPVSTVLNLQVLYKAGNLTS
jgi:hypothetical protein